VDTHVLDESTGRAIEVVESQDTGPGESGREAEEVSTDSGGDTATGGPEVEALPKKKIGRPKGSKHSPKVARGKTTTKILEYRLAGLSTPAISRAAGVSRSTVSETLKKFEPVFKKLRQVAEYQDVRKELLSATELQMLESMQDKDKLEKASINNLAYAFTQVFSARRLEANQSTANVHSQTQVIVTAPVIPDE